VNQGDLPAVSISRLRAAGFVTAEATLTTIRLGDLEADVGVTLRKFPNGGSWSFFLCPQCGRRARMLRLLEGKPLCRHCCIARRVWRREDSLSPARRGARRIFSLRDLLEGGPARLNPRPGRTLDRRSRLEAALQRAEFVAHRGWFGKEFGR
jgi:hypothetical protein